MISGRDVSLVPFLLTDSSVVWFHSLVVSTSLSMESQNIEPDPDVIDDDRIC